MTPDQSKELTELKPCPFCNTPNPDIMEDDIGWSKGYFVRCFNCYASGPSINIEKADAIFDWNTRPLTPQPAAKDEEGGTTQRPEQPEEPFDFDCDAGRDWCSYAIDMSCYADTLESRLTALGLQVEALRNALEDWSPYPATRENTAKGDVLVCCNAAFNDGVWKHKKECPYLKAQSALSLPLSSYERRTKAMEKALIACENIVPHYIQGYNGPHKADCPRCLVTAALDALSSEEPK